MCHLNEHLYFGVGNYGRLTQMFLNINGFNEQFDCIHNSMSEQQFSTKLIMFFFHHQPKDVYALYVCIEMLCPRTPSEEIFTIWTMP